MPDNTPINFTSIAGPLLGHYMQETNAPGMSGAFVQANETETFNAGYTDTSKFQDVTEDTVFGIGSVTKLFTALLLQSKVHAKQMKLSDPVTQYLTAYLPNPNSLPISSVTLQDLATHTSGMPDEAPGKPATQLFLDEPPSTTLTQWWKNFQPDPGVGQCWRYSNAGFVTLGFAVGGSPNTYNPQLASLVTTPLNMPNTGALLWLPRTITLASAYKGTPNTTTEVDHVEVDLYSTARDMGTFLNASIFPDESTAIGKAIKETHKSRYQGTECGSTGRREMGLAWQISTMTSGSHRYSVLSKNGTAAGYEAWIGFIPKRTGFAVLTNKVMTGETGQLTVLCRKIMQQIVDAMTPGKG